MHPLNLLHPRAVLTLPWHCSCVTLQQQLNTYFPTSVSGQKRHYQEHFPWWNFRTDWTNLVPFSSMQGLDMESFLICTGWRVHMIPSLLFCACHLFWGWNYQSCFIFQTYDPKQRLSRKVTSFSASHLPAHTCTQKSQHTVLQTEGLLCSMTWTNHFYQYPIQGWRLLFILEFSCKWLAVAICWNHTPSFLWKSSRVSDIQWTIWCHVWQMLVNLSLSNQRLFGFILLLLISCCGNFLCSSCG